MDGVCVCVCLRVCVSLSRVCVCVCVCVCERGRENGESDSKNLLNGSRIADYVGGTQWDFCGKTGLGKIGNEGWGRRCSISNELIIIFFFCLENGPI